MRTQNIVRVLVFFAVPYPVMAHEQSLEFKINKLSLRIIDLDSQVNQALLLAALALLTSLLVSGSLCAYWAIQTNRNPRWWFVAGIVASYAILPVVLALSAKTRKDRFGSVADTATDEEN